MGELLFRALVLNKQGDCVATMPVANGELSKLRERIKDMGFTVKVEKLMIKRNCEDCGKMCHASPYKYEPNTWLCEDCMDERMED